MSVMRNMGNKPKGNNSVMRNMGGNAPSNPESVMRNMGNKPKGTKGLHGEPEGPPSREQARIAGAKRWDAIRSAQAQVQRDAAREPSSRRRAGDFPGRTPGRSASRPSIQTMARNRLSRRT